MDRSFPAVCRLKSKTDIQAVFTQRNVFRGERLIFYRGARTVLTLKGGVPGGAREIIPPQGVGHPSSEPPTTSLRGVPCPSRERRGNLKVDQASRYCFVVSKECGNAVRRNRIKRVLREIVRLNRYRIPAGYDYIIRANATRLEENIRQEDFIGDFQKYFGWD